MEELEARIAAMETAFIEVMAFVEPGALEDGYTAIGQALDHDLPEFERTVRLGALKLIEDALGRYKPPAQGVVIREP